MYSMRRVRSEGCGPSIEDENTDEVNRNVYIEPYLRRLCEQNSTLQDGTEGTVSDTPLLDQLTGDMYGPKANPTFTSKIYNEHVDNLDETQMDLSGHGQSVDRLQKVWEEHREQYEAVANQVDLPAELIAALHYRESSFNFNTYLHQGDPLGRPAVHIPRDIPVFHEWAPAAVHALGIKKNVQRDVGLTKESNDLAAMATYSEYYNGLGYDYRGIESPYVYGGTNQYQSGHYVADGRFDPNAKDRRLGVVAIVRILKGAVSEEELAEVTRNAYSSGDRVLSVGEKGADVKELQALLIASGSELTVDGDLGPLTDAAVRAFQEENGLAVDGIVGPKTLKALRQQASALCPKNEEPQPAPMGSEN